MDGNEKLRGQLRDAAEHDQREEDISDRAHGFATQGARLAVDRLGRMMQGKKNGKGQVSDTPPEPTPPSSDGAEAPASTSERVQIKTRDAVRDAPVKVYGEDSRLERPTAARSSVKTKDTYIRRQVDGHSEVRKRADSALMPQRTEHTVPVSSPRSVQQTVKTKELFIRQQAVALGEKGASPTPTFQSCPTQPEASQPLEQGRQKFIRERIQKEEAQKIEGHRFESAAPVLAERHESIESPPCPSGRMSLEPVWNEASAFQIKQKISGKGALDDKFPIKEARSPPRGPHERL